MKRIFLTLALVATTLISAVAGEYTEVYKFGKITKIDASFIYEIFVTQGSSREVKVICPDEYREFLSVEYRDNELILKQREDSRRRSNSTEEKIKVYIQMETFEEIDLSGACSVNAEGVYKTDELDIDLSGASVVTGLNISGRELSMDLSGASKVNLTGDFTDIEMDCSGAATVNLNSNAQRFEGDFSGAGKIDLSGNIEYFYAEFSGACKFNGNGEYKNIKTECSGACDVNFNGTAANTLILHGSGACKFDAQNVKAKDVKVTLSGVGKAAVYADETLTIDIIRTSKLQYKGNAKVTNLNPIDNIVKVE